MTMIRPEAQLRPSRQLRPAPGSWRVDPASSHAAFAARIAGRPVRGCLPLSGRVLITEQIEDSTAWLAARTGAVTTGSPMLDRLLAGPAFLDAGAFPEISFQSDLLIWVPAGWRAAGSLQVKDAEHELACQLDLHPGESWPDDSPRIVITSTWVIDSSWVTSQRAPALGRRTAMTCSLSLEPDM